MFEHIFFDLDGTLTDSAPGILNAVTYTLEQFGVDVPSRESLRYFIGPPLMDSFSKGFGFSHETCVEAVRTYRVYFSQKGIFENSVYDGVETMLQTLKAQGKHLYIATSKPIGFAERIADHFGLTSYFDHIYGPDMGDEKSSKADVIRMAMRDSGAQLQTTVMVGDRFHDVKGATANNIPCVGVLYGYGDEKELVEAGALCTIPTVEALTDFLKAL